MGIHESDTVENIIFAHKYLQKPQMIDQQYPLKKQLIIQILEEVRGEDRDDMDLAKVADYLQEISHTHVHQCCLCNHIGIDVTRIHSWHVGGESDPQAPCCDDPKECIARVELTKERERYRLRL